MIARVLPRASLRVWLLASYCVVLALPALALAGSGPHTRARLYALFVDSPGLRAGAFVVAIVMLALAIGAGHWGSRSLFRLARAADRIAVATEPPAALAGLRASHVREVGALAHALATMHARLSERLRYIDEFAGNVAHEFRTPIATLRGTIELIREDRRMPPAQRDRFMANALQELARLDALVGGLLALARAEAPRVRQTVDLDELLDRAFAGRSRVHKTGRAGSILGAPEQLAMMVGNLVENACQHGGALARVHVRAWTRADQTGFDVIDDGPGIAPGHRERIFERFFTTDRRRGIGLGLAMVRLVCRAHGGEVGVRSRPGETIFSVVLPGVDPRQAPVPKWRKASRSCRRPICPPPSKKSSTTPMRSARRLPSSAPL